MAGQTADVGRAVLAGEAARLADRLDRLAQLLSGDVEEWARLQVKADEDTAVLIINGAAAEARQAASTLRGILAQLNGVPRPAKGAPGTPEGGGTIEDELAAMRANRQAGA